MPSVLTSVAILLSEASECLSWGSIPDWYYGFSSWVVKSVSSWYMMNLQSWEVWDELIQHVWQGCFLHAKKCKNTKQLPFAQMLPSKQGPSSMASAPGALSECTLPAISVTGTRHCFACVNLPHYIIGERKVGLFKSEMWRAALQKKKSRLYSFYCFCTNNNVKEKCH